MEGHGLIALFAEIWEGRYLARLTLAGTASTLIVVMGSIPAGLRGSVLKFWYQRHPAISTLSLMHIHAVSCTCYGLSKFYTYLGPKREEDQGTPK